MLYPDVVQTEAAQDKPNTLASTRSIDSPKDYDYQSGEVEKGAIPDSVTSNSRSSMSGAEEKRLLRRIDWRLLPLLAAMYVVKTIDAQNVSQSVPYWATLNS